MKNGDGILKGETSEGSSLSPFRETAAVLVDDLHTQILQTLLYYDIFSYPLSGDEIRAHIQTAIPADTFDRSLQALIDKSWIFQYQGYFSTQDQPSWGQERITRGERSKKYVKIAYRMGKLIASFPFVSGVYVSGSLSKQWIDDEGDIDYFIITRPGRLWIARTFLVLFKKLFLFNSHKYFCVNYFIDEDHLEIEEKNRFTATEIVTLLPIAGKELFIKFRTANQWVKSYFPNYPMPDLSNIRRVPRRGLGKALQALLFGRFGNWLDRRFLLLTLSVWKRKFKSLDLNHFEVALKSRKYVSKHHPNHFQRRVLEAHQEKLRTFEQKHQLAVGTLNDIS
ncbi:MAG: nucleotidyltransferase domain-containing protein [Bacteroidota bacterium]